jgi:hypothetical protein
VKSFLEVFGVVGRTGKQLHGPQNFNVLWFYETFFFQLGTKMNEKIMESLKGSVNSAASIVVIFGITVIIVCASILLAVQVGKSFVFSLSLSLSFYVQVSLHDM